MLDVEPTDGDVADPDGDRELDKEGLHKGQALAVFRQVGVFDDLDILHLLELLLVGELSLFDAVVRVGVVAGPASISTQ